MIGIGVCITIFLALAYLWSVVELRQVAVSASASGDVTAGGNLQIATVVSGPPGFECALSIAGSPWLGVATPTDGVVSVLAPNMGRLDQAHLALQTGVPDGVVGAIEHRTVPLSEPVFVYPAPVVCVVDPAPVKGGNIADPSGEMAGLRDYTPGDRLRDVHWPAVARTGTVLVRDNRSAPSRGPVVVVVPAAPAVDLELIAGHARHAIHVLIQRGHSVELVIGAEAWPVKTEAEAWRRLAVITADQEAKYVPRDVPALLIGVEKGATWLTRT